MTQAVSTDIRIRPSKPRRQVILRPLQYLALAGYMFFIGFPFVFLIATSLKTPEELNTPTPGFLPQSLNFSNFAEAVNETNLVQSATNSAMVALSTTLIVTVLSFPAAYALARFRTKLRSVATGWVLLSQMFPFILVIIPLFLVLQQFGLINSLYGLVLVHSVWALPFALWMMQGYIAGIPVELEEAGAIDGGSRLRVLWAIVLPLLAPGVVATSLFTFISSWNELLFALVLIQDPALETLPLTLARFVGAQGQVQLGALAAASLLATIPSLVFFALIQRRLVSGLLSGAVKG